MKIHIATRDLFFVGRLKASLETAGHAVTAGGPLPEGSEMVLVDTGPTAGPSWGREIEVAKGKGLSVIAFGPHEDLERLGKAKGLGADLVVANSAMMRNPVSVLDTFRLKRDAQRPSGGSDRHGDQPTQ